MTPRRLYFGLCGLICLLVVGLAAGTYGANKLLTSKANQLTELKVKTLALQQESLDLAQAKKEIAQNTQLEMITQAIVPQDKDQAEAVREIVKLAANNDISLSNITFPASTLGSIRGSTSLGSSSGSSGGGSAPSQLQAVKSMPGVYLLTINIASDTNKPASFTQFTNFLSALEQNRRTAQVAAITLQPSANDATRLTFTLTLNEYIKP